MKKITTELYPSKDVIILVKYPSNIVYETQTGGYACKHPSLEGYVLFTYLDSEKLYHYFFNGKYRGWCNNGIDEEDADFIDKLLVDDWKVDRTKLKEGMEAWIPIKKENQEGFLYWQNSD